MLIGNAFGVAVVLKLRSELWPIVCPDALGQEGQIVEQAFELVDHGVTCGGVKSLDPRKT